MSDHASTTDPAIAGVFRRPFPEQVAFFRNKLGNLVPTERWDDMLGAAHDDAFMVAGAVKADLLADLAIATDRAIADGIGLEAFRADFRAIVAKHGWTGWTGEGSVRGEAWRVKTIYRTNMMTSYAAGRMAQLRSENWPLWLYRHGGSREPRLHHLSWDGIALPPDHPFWTTHYPPSDWGCSCYVLGARSARGVKRLGGDPDKQLPKGWQLIDRRTGAPLGIGKGWNYAPGASVSETVSALAGKLEKLPERPSIDLIQEWLRSPSFERWAQKPEGNWPLVRVSDAHAERIGSEVRVAQLSAETMAKQQREHPELDGNDYARAQQVVDAPTHVVQDSPGSLVFIQEQGDDSANGGHVLVVKATRTGKGLFVTSFRRLSRDEAVRDRTIRQLLRRDMK